MRKAEFETKKVLDQKEMVGEQQSIVQSKLDKEREDNKDLREKMAIVEAELDAEQEQGQAQTEVERGQKPARGVEAAFDEAFNHFGFLRFQ